MKTRIYTNTKAEGHYPVGFAAVVVALSPDHAAAVLRPKMEAYGLNPDSVKPEDFEVVGDGTPHAIILNDGNY